MKQRTTTMQLSEALTNNLLQVTKAEVYYKSSRKTDVIEPESFIDNFQFLVESGVFADCIGWHFERDYKTNQYKLETGRMNGDSENIVIVHLRVNEGVKIEDIEKTLLYVEDDQSNLEELAEKV